MDAFTLVCAGGMVYGVGLGIQLLAGRGDIRIQDKLGQCGDDR